MAGELLETKLHVPTLRRSLVPRPRLIERLRRGGESALTLVSASAGFGKTTLLAEWLSVAPDDRPVAWLSLDQRDNDPATFWTYLIAALQRAAPGVGDSALSLLRSQSPTDAVLGSLVNDLHAVPHDVVFVLDDYHLIGDLGVQEGMAFLLEHLPSQVHLVIASRADPALPLARLRSRGQLVEIRTADLRFTADEAAAYLNGAMGLTLTAADVDALEGRTEGWIAALQLAALSMQGRSDVAGFIASFAGDDRFIVDYLIEEVLQRQTAEVRDFLLETSMLNGLTGSLCDAVMKKSGGKAMLEALERANLFVVALDDRRQWYRYHHLFADVLRVRLLDEQPDRLRELHLRASDWYERNGDPSEAVRHALAGEHFERAADLVERAVPWLRAGRHEATLRRWLESLPDEVFTVRPVLSVTYAGALMVNGEVDGVETHLRLAERWLDAPTESAAPTGMVVVDHEAFRGLPTAISMYRAAIALLSGDVAGTIAHARRALEVAAEDNHVGRGGPAGLLGLAYWTTGDLDEARHWYANALDSLEKAGQFPDVTGCAIAVADILLTQGRLRDAMSNFEHALGLVSPGLGTPARGAADMHVGIAQVLLERNDLDGARQHLAASADLGEHGGLPQNRYRWRVAMARLRRAEGDLDAAIELLDDAIRVYVADFSPEVRPVSALKARALVAQGRLAEALDWARDRGLSVDDELSYVREFEHITLARVLLAPHVTADVTAEATGVDGAIGLLDRLLVEAEAGRRTGNVLEILVVQALARHARGDRPAALSALERALALAEPEGYVRLFVDEGAPMAALLTAVPKTAPTARYAARLLASLGETTATTPDQRGIVEPLSARELDVLRLLASDLGGPDIARQMVVSLNTVRTHTKNIYAKLGVNTRREAVTRAGELGLLTRRVVRQP
jgi:LuxR family maltose regulon positive regulatory protein